MKFIEALKLKSKLFFLFILVALGLVGVGVVGTLQINSMKKNIDSLYFGSLVPVTELNNILHTYHNGLENILYKAYRLELSPIETSTKIKSALIHIDKKWKNYKKHFKRNTEVQYVEYTDLEIEAINRYFLRLYSAAKQRKDLSTINIHTLEKKVSFIHNVVEKLINYEIDVAQYERKKFLFSYNRVKKELGLALVVIILVILMITLYVIKSIQNDQTKLEITTRKLKRANKKLENVSYTDSLTNLHNRRYFNLVYERELKIAKRKNSFITFMMLDIDFFKQYNDTYGHIEGDCALQSVSKVLKETLRRPSDYVFRLGGEEFGVIVTDTDESNSAKLARDICDAIRACKLKHETSKVNEYVTLSIGVVCCIADDALDDKVLISRADEMPYEAKETGRDRYIITSNVSVAKTQTFFEDKSA